jgi:hypothetical protein
VAAGVCIVFVRGRVGCVLGGFHVPTFGLCIGCVGPGVVIVRVGCLGADAGGGFGGSTMTACFLAGFVGGYGALVVAVFVGGEGVMGFIPVVGLPFVVGDACIVATSAHVSFV